MNGLRNVWGHLRRDPWALGGLIVVAIYVLAAIFAPLITAINGQDPYSYHLHALDDSGAPKGFGGGISWQHWFGVEPLTGRDLFAIVVYGSRLSLTVGVLATAVSVAIGVTVGLTAGYFGGWYDRIASRVVDVMLGFPSLVFMISLTAIVAAAFPRPVLMVLVIGFFGWPAVARVVRGQALSIRRRTFVVASEAMGAGDGHVLWRQLLPNVGATIIVYATILVPSMIGTEAALSFLGVGVPPPTPSWGRAIGDAVAWFSTDPAYLAFPGGALFLITLALNAFGDGLRDALDPRVNRRRGIRSTSSQSAHSAQKPSSPEEVTP
ncbi:ABC transporter permease [Gryllotalpicola daejeonensis]|uniref:ABC transporter permease n=1 Tax=Gryllotalpicola daejeonensis TaxID=993087 RepID=A0ABP7ZLD5_9MICO